MRAIALGIVLGVVSPPVTAGQAPGRDTPAQRQRGSTTAPTGRITGRVIAADNGRPVRRARVLLTAAELPGGRGALTDADGLFEFTELPAGRYSLGVSKSGFISLSYGQRRPLQPGTPLQLGEAEQLRGLEFRLPRGSVISGQILDEVGDPLPGVSVRVLAFRYAQGTRQLVPVGAGMTDDRGQYRVWGLNPGDYYVSAAARNFNVGPPGAPGVPLRFPGAGRGGRGGGPPNGNVGGTGAAPVADGTEQTGYAPTYYPGVESVAQARPVTVGLGAEAPDISFSILLVRTARVSGRVVAGDGTPVSTGMVVLMPEGQTSGRLGPGAGFNGRLQWDGTFAMPNVPPGRYVLRARGDDWDSPQFATMPLTVSGDDLAGVTVVLLPGATLTGTATFLRSQGLPPDPTQFRVAAPGTDGALPGPQPNARVDENGRFTLDGVAAGGHWLRTQTPRGWTVKSIVVEGRDVTDVPVELRSGQRMTLAVTFTDQLSEITGLIRDTQGNPLTDYTVLAFADDASRWYPQSRFIMTARPDQTGRYQLRGLPPGEYLLAIVDPAEANEWYEPAFLDQQRSGAVRLQLAEGDRKTQHLTGR
ncbi:MAG: carboxypeptidase regulatory-like domain-containing protein [Vicinamibacterales bacterium]